MSEVSAPAFRQLTQRGEWVDAGGVAIRLELETDGVTADEVRRRDAHRILTIEDGLCGRLACGLPAHRTHTRTPQRGGIQLGDRVVLPRDLDAGPLNDLDTTGDVLHAPTLARHRADPLIEAPTALASLASLPSPEAHPSTEAT